MQSQQIVNAFDLLCKALYSATIEKTLSAYLSQNSRRHRGIQKTSSQYSNLERNLNSNELEN
jgi:hypothetical protein